MASIAGAGVLQAALDRVLPRPVRNSGVMLVVANALPLYGVLAWDWPLFHVMALYWAENLIAGAWVVLRVVHVDWRVGSVFGAFFSLLYGMFCYGQGLLVNSLFNPDDPSGGGGVEQVAHTLLESRELLLAAALLVVSHGWPVLVQVLSPPSRARDHAVGNAIKDAGKRAVALHGGIIAGAAAIAAFNAPVIALVALIVIKTAFDLGLHNRAHLRPRAGTTLAPELSR